ncbi:MAG: PorP/SprF family type IX secretion system membrane protein [Bacteroidales bacterium]|nr:PorP/SprF family type IX secretion system membrane protein [Bacteroidales bacterium]
MKALGGHIIYVVASSLILLMFSQASLKAQDIHFSQSAWSPLNLNPAETGQFRADHRLTMNYRNQWGSVTVPYKTFSAAYENLQRYRLKWPANIGMGLLFNSDVAGDGNFGTIQVKFSAAYHHLSLLDSTLDISAGINVAYNQHSIDFNRLYFDSQYNGSQFDPSSQSNEYYQNDRFSYLDMAIGALLNYTINPTLSLRWGLALNHVNKPKQAFFSEEDNRLEHRFNTYGTLQWRASTYWSIQPSVYYFRQGKYNELIYGVFFQKDLNQLNWRTINFALYNRNQDAIIFRVGAIYQSFDLGFSYDMNYSSLKVASRGIGAFEFSLIYLMYNPQKRQYLYNKQCPVFM